MGRSGHGGWRAPFGGGGGPEWRLESTFSRFVRAAVSTGATSTDWDTFQLEELKTREQVDSTKLPAPLVESRVTRTELPTAGWACRRTVKGAVLEEPRTTGQGRTVRSKPVQTQQSGGVGGWGGMGKEERRGGPGQAIHARPSAVNSWGQGLTYCTRHSTAPAATTLHTQQCTQGEGDHVEHVPHSTTSWRSGQPPRDPESTARVRVRRLRVAAEDVDVAALTVAHWDQADHSPTTHGGASRFPN